MKLKKHDGDWYEIIGFAHHCIEGNAYEMREIAETIKDHGSVEFKRCAVKVTMKNKTVEFWSPRNGISKAVVSLKQAEGLADEIIRQLGKN